MQEVFVGSDGQSVKLVRKQHTVPATDPDYWKSDESYGININELLERIESNKIEEGARSIGEEALHYSTDLWVEKYRPQRFLDLVGNERINRLVLGWLREWSYAVFKEDVGQKRRKRGGNDDDTGFQDTWRRPSRKILLISGPPGIGKTSVAHVAAKQAGFTVSEINASDDRSYVSTRDKLHNTLFNHSFSEKPVCLVIDEIDGSLENGIIKVLTGILQNDIKASNTFNSKSKAKDRKSNGRILMRPIICVCNNLYAPSLEKLKPFAQVINVRKPSENAIQEKLKHICQLEKIELGKTISTVALQNLIDASQGDIRSCINNLQFMARDNNLRSRGCDGQGSTIKDNSTSWFKLVNQLFRKNPYVDYKLQFKQLMEQVQDFGNYDRLVQGCHQLYPSVKYSDIGVHKPAGISDWLYFHDLMSQSIYLHNGELMKYSAVVPLTFHQTFGDIANKEDLRVKNVDYEFREAYKKSQDLLKLVLSKAPPSIVPFTSKEALLHEVLPHLDYMINSDLSKCKDIAVKQKVLDIMVSLLKVYQIELTNLNYDQQENKTLLNIEPPIEQIVLLDEARLKEVHTKRQAILNLLLSKVEENKVRKRHFEKISNGSRSDGIESGKKDVKRVKSSTNSVDFFKQQYGLVQNTQAEEKNSSRPHDHSLARIWIKYKEGFSNAVRKDVNWNSLWQ